MRRDILKFLSGFAAAMSFVHIAAATATARGMISVPIWRGREWGIAKMLIEAVVYGAIGVGLGYLGWRPEPRPTLPAEPATTGASEVADRQGAASA
jgi:hypothetical protein